MNSKRRTTRDTLAIAAAIALALTVSACGSRNETPALSAPVGSSTASATTAPVSGKADASAPAATSAGNAAGVPSNLNVDVSSFDDWDDKPTSLTPVAVYDVLGSKERTCNDFFVANGLAGYDIADGATEGQVIPQGGWDGRQISDWFGPRFDLAWKLNLDKSNPKYAEVADKLLQCLTSQHLGTESNGSGISQTYDAYSILSDLMRGARDGSGSEENPLGDMSTITQQTIGGAWTNGRYNESSVEYLIDGNFGRKANLAIKYEYTKMSDYRAVGYYYDTDYTQFNK